MEPVTASLVAAGISAAGQGAQAYAQGKMNKKTREWNEKMYALQRQHSLQDWAMQNEYNSPKAQMQRLKMAGLNPNLVYGKGADNISGVVRSAEAKGWNPETPNVNFGSIAQTGLNAYFDTQLKQGQIDNLKTQNTVLANEAILKAAQTLQTQENTKGTSFDNELKKELRQTTLEAASANLRKLNIEADIALQANDRAAALNASNISEAVERILSSREQRAKTLVEKEFIREQIKDIKSNQKLKQLDINLKELGVQPGDNIILRAAGQFLNSSKFSNIKESFNKIKSQNYWMKDHKTGKWFWEK